MRRTKFQGIVKQVWASDPDRVYLAQYGTHDMEPLALRLFASRRAAGLCRCAVAYALGVHPSTVMRWETGTFHTISRKHVGMWALLTNVDPEWIITGEGKATPMVRRLCRENGPYYKILLDPLPDKLHIASTPEQFFKWRLDVKREG